MMRGTRIPILHVTGSMLLVALSMFCAVPAGAQGGLIRLGTDGKPAGACPLKFTEVQGEISGPIARVTVTQQFENDAPEIIEAVYTFPLPHRAAVDDMEIRIGQRVVRGAIRRREEARAVYEAAKARGHLAALLEQERPNIFTQSVTNIPPGARVRVVIRYVETLPYEDGRYEFVFPAVVGPRYIPGQPAGRQGGGWAQDTDRVPDASRITPPVTPPSTRAGHDISIEVRIDAGVPIRDVESGSHEILVERPTLNRAVVRLKRNAVLPNKDFVLRYGVAGRGVQTALLAHRDSRGGFFTLIVAPPEKLSREDVAPKEVVFVLDTSGSMSGFPIEKAKEAIAHALAGLYPRDTFNLITFSGDTHILFPEPVPATPENLDRARQFLASRRGSGGTEMMKAIRAALDPSDSADHVRIACFLTDGYVGNDMEILDEVQRHPNARVFAFGIGSAVNRFLLSRMAELGRGEAEFVSLSDDGSAAARRFHERIRNPLLTDITVDWAGLPVSHVHPRRIPDLFGAKPVILTGRYHSPARGVIRLRGRLAGQPFVREIPVELPAAAQANEALASLWARAEVEDLMAEDYLGMQRGRPRNDLREEITQLGLEYRLMTPFTSLVAVEETVITDGGKPRRIEVPVEMPEGVSYEGVFGEVRTAAAPMAFAPRGVAGNAIGGLVGGVPGSVPASMPTTIPPARLLYREDLKDREPPAGPQPKLAPALEKLLAQLRAGADPATLRHPALKGEKVEATIWLKGSPEVVVRRIREVGGEVLAELSGRSVIVARLPWRTVEALAAMTEIVHIAPARG